MSLIELEFRVPDLKISFIDKLMHLGAYTVLMITGGMYYLFGKDKKARNSRMLILGLLLIGYGILIEVLQKVLPVNRWWEIWDVLANTTGVFLGVLVLKAIAGRGLR
ncbi:MAG: VanZ family protein [Bacteroidia bacterium]|nr:VanZ family protein [Bacteroidia bacterium]